ncbi:MAG: ParB/RepB/Spo0J family partition protein [Tannerellaceae bacterium]|jgi:ParB family chromosome partitioning protein|nr:ParB/RepB/Spo0J family partition protein [Tannerellaceae bacterium]
METKKNPAGNKKSPLGRGFRGDGLAALLGEEAKIEEVKADGSSSINEIELSKIQPNPDQPRTFFDEEALEELATSVRAIGIIQPITLKEVSPDSYMIISGERRYRASLMAGLNSIPAYVKTAADENVVEMALIENIQREDLNSIEIALAYQKLIDVYKLTQEKLSERVGKKRTTIANYLRLLKLPAGIQMSLKDKKIDMGHARALIPVENAKVQLALFEQIMSDGLSVRAVEDMVRRIAAGEDLFSEKGKEKESKSKSNRKPTLPEEYKMLKDHLSRFFNTKVQLSYSEDGKGKISIPIHSEDDLERLIGLFDKLK